MMIKNYYRAVSRDDAWQKIKQGYRVIGGGTYLSQHQEDVSAVVDLQNLGLNGINQHANRLEVGASTTFQDLFENELVPISLKKAIHQELKLNQRNSVTIAGYLCCSTGFSLIQGWLLAANVKLTFYPSQEIVSWNPIGEVTQLHQKGFIEKVLFEASNTIRWNYIARSPADLAQVGVFASELSDGVIRVVLTGFNAQPQPIDLYDRRLVKEQVRDYLINAHSHFNNKFVSYDYYFKNSLVILDRLLEVGN